MNNDSHISSREALSALADGELRGTEFAAALGAAQTPDALETWHRYQLIGDVLRSSDTRCSAAHDSAFLQTLRGRLASETVAPPRAIQPIVVRAAETPVAHAEAANDGVWRWKLAAGLASVTAVGVLAWSVAGPMLSGQNGAVLARANSSATPAGAVLVASPDGAILRDPRLDEMLAAHRQIGGNSALQMPAGFLRNATFEGNAR